MANPLESAARQQYTLPAWARQMGRKVESLPWGSSDAGDGTGSVGNAGGEGYYAPLAQFTGRVTGNGDSQGYQQADPEGAMDWLRSTGQQLYEANDNNQIARWLQDAQGNITAEPMVGSTRDNSFGLAALLAGGLVGGSAAGLFGGAGAGGASAGAAGTAGAAGSGIGTLGTIAPGSSALAPIATTGLASTAPAITASIPQVAGAVGAGLGTLGAIAPGSAALEPIAATGLASTAPAVSSSIPAIGGAAGATGALSQAVSGAGSQIGNAAGSALGGGMDWSDWAKIGATLIGSGIQSNAASNAVDAQGKSTEAAIAESRRQFDLQRADGAPYRDAGTNALAQFQTLTNTPTTAADVMQDPGYQFGLDQGQQAIDRKVAAMGGRVSGSAIKAAGRFGTNYASTGYTAADQRRNDRLNRLAALAGIGQSATNASAQAGSAMAGNIGGLMTGQGNAAGGAMLAQGNIWGNTANQLAALYGRGSQQTGNRPPTSPFANYGGDYNSLEYRP